jgi:hypothetical protein
MNVSLKIVHTATDEYLRVPIAGSNALYRSYEYCS